MLSVNKTFKGETPNLPACPSAIEVNEILLHVFSYLSQMRLKVVAAPVSRRWRLVASGLLHHCFHIDKSDTHT